MLSDIIIEKRLLLSKKLHKILRYLYWFLDVRDVVLDYMNKELSSDKIYEFMSFLHLIKYKDIILLKDRSHKLIELENGLYKEVLFIIGDSYKILELEDSEYIVKFILDPQEFKIEYTIKESNINYLFNVDNHLYAVPNNIIFNQVKDNIDDILNRQVYDICKKYFLKGDTI